MNRVAGEICCQPLHPDTSYEKIEKTVQPVIRLGLLAFQNAVRQSGAHASFSVFDCDEYIERKPLSQSAHTLLR